MLEPFQEICRTSLFLNRIEETSMVWCTSHIAARTDKGIHLYGFSKNPKCMEKKIDFTESFIKTPTSSPCSDLLKKLNKSQLKNRELAEFIMDTAFWPHSDLLSKELNTVVSFEWSPRNILPNDECILAIVNNTGSVELFVNGRNVWIRVLDFSSLVHEQFSQIYNFNVKSFEEVQLAVFSLESCSICWSPVLKDRTSYFVTGQKSGTILFWSIECVNENITAKFCGKFDTDFGETVTLLWIPESDSHFMLISTNLHGQIAAYECQIDKDIISLNNCHFLWEHQDKMLVQHIQYEIIGNQFLMVYHKHRHLVLQLVDHNCKVVSQVINNVNDYRITSIARGDGNFYVSTVNFKLYRIKYFIENNIMKVDFDLINLKEISETSELYSVTFSESKALCAISMIDRKVLHKKERLKLEILFLNVLPNNTAIHLLLNNPTKQMTCYWDCIQVLRYKIVKAKALPILDYANLLSEGNEDLYKLKIYLIILTVYKCLEISAKIHRTSLPEESIETIKDKILLAQAKSNVVKFYSEHCSKKSLSDLEKEFFMGSKMFLEYYCKKYKIPLDEIVTQNMLDLTFEIRCYTCQSCDEEIKDFSCKNGHLNMFCMLTFTPIESADYLSCKNCDTIARVELKINKNMCLFCDSHLSDSHLPV